MSDGGKGSKPRPLSVSQEEYDNRWDNIFGRDKPKEDNTGTSKNEYYDTLSTEDCLTENQHITATKDMSNLLNK
jgi:hypothetical protein